MGLLNWFKEKWEARKQAAMFEREVVVSATEFELTAAFPDGTVQSIPWSAVNCIAIETNDSGPWGADLWWLFEGKSSRCAYPGGATGDLEILRLLPPRFPGFSDEQVIKANGCTSNARFVCWERTSAL